MQFSFRTHGTLWDHCQVTSQHCAMISPLLFPQDRFAVPERYIFIPMQPRLLEKSHLTSMTWKLISWASVVIKSMVPKVPALPWVPFLRFLGETLDRCSLNSFGTTIALRGSCTLIVLCRMQNAALLIQVSFSNNQEHLPICRLLQLTVYSSLLLHGLFRKSLEGK